MVAGLASASERRRTPESPESDEEEPDSSEPDEMLEDADAAAA
jgi:hypothetical protein